MRINREILENGVLKLDLAGRLDTTTSSLLREEISGIPDNIRKVIMDFKDLEYISSAGLRELLICRKRFTGDRMKIIHVAPAVYEIFVTTGFDAIIPMEMAGEDLSTYMNLSFKDFLKKKVELDPDSVFLVDERGAFTWKDVDIYSQIIADGLEKKGVKKGTHVALCGSNSINWVLTFFAIQKLGAMAQLLNFNMKASEIASVARIGDITHFCYGQMPEMKDEEAFIRELKACNSPLTAFISVRNDRQDIRERKDEYEAIQHKFGDYVEADAPCAMIFTSGSTGNPKGVLLSAYNILNAANSTYKVQHLTKEDRTCLILPLFHIFGLVAGLFANAVAGSRVYFPENMRTGTLLEVIEKDKCTVFHSVPTMLLALLNNKDFAPDRLGTLRCTILAGAGATEVQIRKFEEKLPNDHFMSSYGLSEMAPVTVTDYEDSEDHLIHTVGKPVDNISIMIRDTASGEECKTGVPGEVLVQGYNLMTGYYKLGMDDQAIDDKGWLHTGDLGFLDEEGYLHLSGRQKELIIRGGENIMPAEIEKAVSELDIIDDVKVIGVPSDFYGEEVCACIKLLPGASFDEARVRDELAKSLARFKIPGYFVVYNKFPMLGSGKIDTVTLKKDVLTIIRKENTK